MSAPTLFVSRSTRNQAEQLLRSGTGDGAREAVALLLHAKDSGTGGCDCGSLLSQGLSVVIKRPHEALGVEIGSSEGEVRRAFRKQALKFHPDKTGGLTTALFQSLQTASQKAVDPKVKPPPPIPKQQQQYEKQPSHHGTRPTPKNPSSSSANESKDNRSDNDPYHPSSWERQEKWQQQQQKEEALKRARKAEAARARAEHEKAQQAKEYERYRKERESRDEAYVREMNEKKQSKEAERARQRAKEEDEAAAKRRARQRAEEEVFAKRRAEEEEANKKRYAKMKKEEETNARKAAAAQREAEVLRRRQEEEDAAAKLRFFTSQEKAKAEELKKKKEEEIAARLRVAAAARREAEVLRRRQLEEEEAARLRFSKDQAAEAAEKARKVSEEAMKVARAARAAEIRRTGEAAYQSEKDNLHAASNSGDDYEDYHDDIGGDAGGGGFGRTAFGQTPGGWRQAAEEAAARAAQAQESAEEAAKEAEQVEERHHTQTRARNMRPSSERRSRREDSPDLSPFPDDTDPSVSSKSKEAFSREPSAPSSIPTASSSNRRPGRYRAQAYTVGADGKVRASPARLISSSDSDSDGELDKSAKYAHTRPFSSKREMDMNQEGSGGGMFEEYLRPCKLVANSSTATSVRLEWVGPPKEHFDIQWRACGNDEVDWSGPARVKKNKCMKNNLQPDTIYEFRVRSATPKVSIWSDSIACLTLTEEEEKEQLKTKKENKNKSKNQSKQKESNDDGVVEGVKSNTTPQAHQSQRDEEGFQAAWDQVQARFEAGADEAELKTMLEQVAEMYVTSETAPEFMMNMTKKAAEKLNHVTASSPTSLRHAKVTPSSPPIVSSDINNGKDHASNSFKNDDEKARRKAAEDEAERAAVQATLDAVERDRGVGVQSKEEEDEAYFKVDEYSDEEYGNEEDGGDEEDDDDDEDEEEDEEEVKQELMLSTGIAGYMHSVRAEPFAASPVVGYLMADRSIQSGVRCGGWIRVEYHEGRRFKRRKAPLRDDGVGWCLEHCDEAILVPYSSDIPSKSPYSFDEGDGLEFSQEEVGGGEGRGRGDGLSGDGVDEDDEEGIDFSDTANWGGGRWHEKVDDKSEIYYWNELNGELSWEKPVWVEEVIQTHHLSLIYFSLLLFFFYSLFISP